VLVGRVLSEYFGFPANFHSTSCSIFTSLSIIVAVVIRVIESRRMRWAGHVAWIWENRNAHRILVGKSEGKRSVGIRKRRWENNIKMDLREIGCGTWTGLISLRIGTN
jgi:hypothetical protein